MRASWFGRRHVLLLAGAASGCAVAGLLVSVAGTAVAQRSQESARAVFDASHLPPLLTLPGERVGLSYDVHCAPEGVEDPETGCDVHGAVYLRRGPRDAFRALRLETTTVDGLHRLVATVPADVAGSGGFEYYAELGAAAGDRILVPAGGADAPYRSLRAASSTEVSLGVHRFGPADPGVRVASAPWGDDPASVGLEHGRNLPAIGASAFDVDDDGTVTLLDEAHRRALRWAPSGAGPTRIPLAIDGRMADMTVDEDGSIYVLESVAPPGRTPLLRLFDPAGRALHTVETAEPDAAQVRIGPNGPVVLERPSHQWMPVVEHGLPTPPRDQRRKGVVGRPLRSGREVVVLRREHDVLAALVSNRDVERSWRITSSTPLGEIQLAEPVGRQFVLVVRVYSDATSQFVVLVLDRDGIARVFSTPADEWAETTAIGRFRIGGTHLYRLGSDTSGAFVARYDLEGA